MADSITALAANKMIGLNHLIKVAIRFFTIQAIRNNQGTILRTPGAGVIPNFIADCESLTNADTNAFIFTKDEIMSCFEDDAHKPAANYLMVLLGSHFETEGSNIEGEPTVLIAGCNRDSSGDYVSLTEVQKQLPALEHPPRTYRLILREASMDKTGKALNIIRVKDITEVKKENAYLAEFLNKVTNKK